jgi:gliding motility-associated-like protein
MITVPVLVNPSPVLGVSPSSTLCYNTTTTFSATGASAYTWMPGGSTAPAITLTATAPVVYTLSGLSSAGCFSSNTITFSVIPLPTVGIVSSLTVCSGNAVSLSASGASSYSWLPVNLAGASISPTPAATMVFTVVGTTNGCSSSANRTITVLPTPTLFASAAPATVCPGGNAWLTVTGASSYTWMPGSSNATLLAVFPQVTATYSVTGRTSNGCSSTASVLVNVEPTPTIVIAPANTLVCLGSLAGYTATGANSYTWSYGNVTGPVLSVYAAGPSVFTVTGSGPNGCTATNTAVLNVIPLPVITASATPLELCPGKSATLTASGASGYTWSPGSFPGSVVTVFPPSTTVYTVTGSLNGCESSTVVTVTIRNFSVFASVSNAFDCTVTTASVFVAPVFTNNTVLWSGAGITSGATTATATVNKTGLYFVTVTDTITKCTASHSVQVTSNAAPLIFTVIPSSEKICIPGNTISLLFTGPGTGTWFPLGSTTPGTGQVVSASPSVSTTYSVRVALGVCEGNGAATVYVATTPTVVAAASSASLCAGTSVTLTASGADGYVWIPGPLYGSKVVFTPASSGVYTVTGTHDICSDTRTVNVEVFPLPVMNAYASSEIICIGDSTLLLVSGAATFTWFPLQQQTIWTMVKPLATTIYTVIGATAAGCPDTLQIKIKVNPLPEIFISALPDSICQGETIQPRITGAQETFLAPRIFQPYATQVYTATGYSDGCATLRTFTVYVKDCLKDFFIPGGFSPDGDGLYDYFEIRGVPWYDIKLTVFNRWGNKVYEKDHYDNSWDGRVNVSGFKFGNGILPSGTYYYIVDFNNTSDISRTGFVILRN